MYIIYISFRLKCNSNLDMIDILYFKSNIANTKSNKLILNISISVCFVLKFDSNWIKYIWFDNIYYLICIWLNNTNYYYQFVLLFDFVLF